MKSMIQNVADGIARRWCKLTHPDPMWPVCGMYRCPQCHRTYAVPWEEKPRAERKQMVIPVAAPAPSLLEGMGDIAFRKAG